MTDGTLLAAVSDALADVIRSVAPSVVQVEGQRRPASGVACAPDAVITTARALGRSDGLRVRRHDDTRLEAELAGWDPTTGLAALRVPGLGTPALEVAASPARVGHLALAVARSWSNNVTASAGIVSIIGGPLPTGRRRAIDTVIRTTAPMHDGFAGGAFVDVRGHLLGITTASTIRGLAVVIPATIAWSAARTLLEHGSLQRGYLGIAGQAVDIAAPGAPPRRPAFLVVDVTEGSPAARGGMIVGDLLLEFDGQRIGSPDDLLDLLHGDRVGARVTARVLRAGTAVDLSIEVGQRAAS